MMEVMKVLSCERWKNGIQQAVVTFAKQEKQQDLVYRKRLYGHGKVRGIVQCSNMGRERWADHHIKDGGKVINIQGRSYGSLRSEA